MVSIRTWMGVSLTILASAAACAPVVAPGPPQEDCAADDPRVGQTASLQTRFHRVSGVARIVDDCTIVIENFSYDGGGLDVRVVVATAADFSDLIVLSDDLRRAGGYTGETLSFTLPVGATLADATRLSVWCVSAGQSFGDGVFD